MINLNLKKNETRFNNLEGELLSLFHKSATGKSNKTFRFAKVDNNFSAFLPYLTDGAVKLYLYYAIAASNATGESWHGIDTISQKLGATARSIGNWNNQLEDLGLIFRTSTGKKSKTTFVLPLTGFAVRMSIPQIKQILDELNLSEANEYTRVFGKALSVTKLYIADKSVGTVNEILCLHLQRSSTSGSMELNRVDTFVYDLSSTTNEDVTKELLRFETDDEVTIVNYEKKTMLELNDPSRFKCYYINDSLFKDSPKVDDHTVYEIMRQLTDDVDLTNLAQITI